MENSSINVNFEPVENEKDQEAVIEAVLFTIGGAVELRQLAAAIGQDKETAKRAVERLAKRYREETRGMEIKQLEDSYQMCTRSEYYENLIRVAASPKKQVLSDVICPTSRPCEKVGVQYSISASINSMVMFVVPDTVNSVPSIAILFTKMELTR